MDRKFLLFEIGYKKKKSAFALFFSFSSDLVLSIFQNPYSLLGDKMKRIFTALGVMTLVCFSFYYTEQIALLARNADPLMKEILNVYEEYEVPATDAVLTEQGLIPGINGLKVDLNKSYSNMKRLGEFNASLFVFEEVSPEFSSEKQYDHYFIQGNESRQSVSLIFQVKNENYLDRILQILTEKQVVATFFVDGEWAENKMETVYEMAKEGHEIENGGYDGNYAKEWLVWTNNLLESITNVEPKYCYTKYRNNSVLDLCSTYHMYSVKPTILTSNYPFNTVKKNLQPGAIIHLEMNQTTATELGTLINYIKQKGYQFETLASILSENGTIEK